MSFLAYQAGLWQPASAAEHAVDTLNQINAILQANNVTDANGNLIQLAASLGNVVWIMCLAVGNIQAVNDQNLLSAAQQFSIQQESPAQLMETLPMVGTSLIPGAYSLLSLQVTATSAGCTINAGTKAPYGTVCNFIVQNTTVIPSNGSALILCQSDTLGPIAVAASAVTAFSTTIPGVSSVYNPSGAIVGRNLETIQQLQQRLLLGNVINTNLDGTIRAIQGIQGLTAAVVWLNQSPTTPLVLAGGASIPALSSYIVVEGSDITGVAIANAYAARMLAQTWSVGIGTPYTRTDLTFAAYPTNTITTSGGNFITAGFALNQWVQITGSVSNPFIGKIVGLTASVMTLGQCQLIAESDANSITITIKNVQVYTTASGQQIPIQYDVAALQQIDLTVYYYAGTNTASNIQSSIAAILSALPWQIGQLVTSQLILAALQNFPYATITGAQVALHGGGLGNEAVTPGNMLPVISASNVTAATG